jgi:hypothetical protein
MSHNNSEASEITLISRGEGQTPIVLELKHTNYALTRIDDIRIINPMNLPDLLTVFLKSMNELSKAIGFISAEIVKTKYALDRVKSNLLLHEMPKILAEKNIKSSEDIRNAILCLDPKYSELSEQLDMLEAVLDNLRAKNKNMETATFNCKTVIQYTYMPPKLKDYSNTETGIGEKE